MLLALGEISKNHASTLEEPADVLDNSEPAAQRLFRAARENFGVEIRQASLKQPILEAVHCEDNYGLRVKSRSDFEEKNLQVPEDQSETLPGTTEDHVDGITLSNFEIAGGINV